VDDEVRALAVLRYAFTRDEEMIKAAVADLDRDRAVGLLASALSILATAITEALNDQPVSEIAEELSRVLLDRAEGTGT
jgi:hypothetical protein